MLFRSGSKSNGNEKESIPHGVHSSNSVFTWSKVGYPSLKTHKEVLILSQLYYTVGTAAKPLVLLNDVQGWCKPGTLTACVPFQSEPPHNPDSLT